MRTYHLFLICAFLITGCKNNTPEGEKTADPQARTAKQSDGLTLLKGDFLYMADAAVLQTHREIYGVVIDEKMHELNEMVKPYKSEDTDMIPVEIRGKISPKPAGEEGWPYRVAIKEILNVSEPDPNDNETIKIVE